MAENYLFSLPKSYLIIGGEIMTGIIYKITNTINGKVYIGKTLETIEKRWKEH
jgi:hypothetical protein